MSILRNNLKEKFSQLPNELITDERLSHGAFRVAAYLFSKPHGWNILNGDIQKQLGIKQAQTLADYWRELLLAGWVTRQRKKENGKIVGGFDYALSLNRENPYCGKTLNRENATLRKNPTHSNTDLINNTEKINNTNPKENTPPIGEAADFEDYEKQILENSVTAVLESLNLHAGRNLPVKGDRAEANRKKIKALFKKKYTEAEMKDVIQCKCFEWGKDAKMAQYLHPSTLFLPSNFQKYLDLVTDLKNDSKKAELFKKKINGASKQPGELISQQSLTNITARILDDLANGRPL